MYNTYEIIELLFGAFHIVAGYIEAKVTVTSLWGHSGL